MNTQEKIAVPSLKAFPVNLNPIIQTMLSYGVSIEETIIITHYIIHLLEQNTLVISAQTMHFMTGNLLQSDLKTLICNNCKVIFSYFKEQIHNLGQNSDYAYVTCPKCSYMNYLSAPTLPGD